MQSKASTTPPKDELTHSYLQRVSSAEDTEEVQQAFTTYLQGVLSRVSGAQVEFAQGDVRVDPKAEDGYTLGPTIAGNMIFTKILADPDLKDIVRRQAGHAANKMTHLGRHTGREETKLFPRKDRRR